MLRDGRPAEKGKGNRARTDVLLRFACKGNTACFGKNYILCQGRNGIVAFAEEILAALVGQLKEQPAYARFGVQHDAVTGSGVDENRSLIVLRRQ